MTTSRPVRHDNVELLIAAIVAGIYPRPRSERIDPAASAYIAMVGSIAGAADTGEQVEALCQTLADLTDATVDWSCYCGRYVIKATVDHKDAVIASLRELVPLVASALPDCKYGGHRIQASWLTAGGVLDRPVDCVDRRSAAELAADHTAYVATWPAERRDQWWADLESIRTPLPD